MNYYSKEQLIDLNLQKFAFIACEVNDHVLTLTLDREEKRNALHPHMVNEIAYALNYAHVNNDIWAVLIKAKGKIFCAGADLKAFMGLGGEFESSIPKPEQEVLLGELFHAVHKPIITQLEGDVYAGGLFFIAGSHYIVASSHVKLGLPEVKRGIFPFQVMNELLKVMPSRTVLNWCIMGDILSAQKALEMGLITHISEPEEVGSIVQNIIKQLKENSPSAIRLGLEAFEHITKEDGKHQYLMEMLQKTVKTQDGKEGILAFKEKRKPQWTGE